jgi:GNAT superfamily N-acetyltransferase
LSEIAAASAAGGVRVRQAGPDDLDGLVPLFLGYLAFYEQPADRVAAGAYLAGHLASGSSTVLLAGPPDGPPVGFAQLYPTWDSLALRNRWILYDLFVAPDARRQGVGRGLLEACIALARSTGASALSLDTARDNLPAQALYTSLGFQPDEVFVAYHHDLGSGELTTPG